MSFRVSFIDFWIGWHESERRVEREADPSLLFPRSETNLKIKQALPQTSTLISPTAVSALRGHILSESPNASVHTYTGSLNLSSNFNDASSSAPLPLGPDQMLLRGAQIRNTGWVYGVVVVGGKETKLMRNAT